MTDVDIHTRGPVFNGNAERIIERAVEVGERKIADEAYELIQRRLPQVLKHPTGHYQSRISVVQRGPSHVVTGGGVIYHNWLEGEGSRNFPATRFRGYHTFRKAQQEIDGRAENMMEDVLDPVCRRL